jgi:hypothetical protein
MTGVPDPPTLRTGDPDPPPPCVHSMSKLSEVDVRNFIAAYLLVPGLINTREVGLGLSFFFFRFLYLWEFVAQRPRYEPRQRTESLLRRKVVSWR